MLRERVAYLEAPVVPSLPRQKIGSQSNSVRRALLILELLKNSGGRRSLSEISRKLSLPKSSASIVLSTLESMGYVTRDDERCYSLSSKTYGLGLEQLNELDLSRRSRGILETVANSLKVTANVAVLSGDQALFIHKVDGVRNPCCDIYPGRRTNLQCTAVGKILLAYASEEDQRMLLARHRPIRHTSRTIVAREALMEEIGWVRKRGYALDNQEEELHVRCLAVPLFSKRRPAAAMGIAGTLSEIRPDNIEELASYLKQMSSQISS